MKKLIVSILTAATALAANTAPAKAATEADVIKLLELVKATGTQVSSLNNREAKGACIGKEGFYVLNEETQEDFLIICSDQVNLKNTNKVWEVVAHEATHLMQACIADDTGTLFPASEAPSMLRELRAYAPHYFGQLQSKYASIDASPELEAFWMELQPPADVHSYMKEACGHLMK